MVFFFYIKFNCMRLSTTEVFLKCQVLSILLNLKVVRWLLFIEISLPACYGYLKSLAYKSSNKRKYPGNWFNNYTITKRILTLTTNNTKKNNTRTSCNQFYSNTVPIKNQRCCSKIRKKEINYSTFQTDSRCVFI